MKRFLALTLLLIALILPAYATTSISFMGISMDLDIETFCNKLVTTHKFKIVEQESSVYKLSGTYMGVQKCTVSVASRSNGRKVAMVVVTFPKKNTWKELKEQFNDVLRRFRVNPQYSFVNSSTSFDEPYYDGCSNEMEGVRNDKCNYYSVLSKDDNVLLVGIDTDQTVNVYYVDSNTVDALFAAMEGSSSSSSSGATTPSGSSSTQSSSTALTFLNIPMRGNYRDFAQRLIDERNFTYYSENESVPSISLRGVIDSKENSEVYVFGDSNSKQISNLDVYLPEQSTWRDIYREYETYVNHFKADYSVLDSSAEFSEYTSGDEVQQVRNGNCDYSTAFDVPGGIIIVRISRYMQVQLSYICC